MALALQSQRSWPTESQKLLLRAILADGDAAAAAWRAWQDTHDFGSLDIGSVAILPNLYLNLMAQGIDIDGPFKIHLKNKYQYTWISNLNAKRSLLKVSSILEEANIKFMVPKGFPLALFHYPDLGARYMGDIDLLIEPEDLAATAKLLREHEWDTNAHLLPAGLAPYIHALEFHHPNLGCLDMHWAPFRVDSPARSKREFWNRTFYRDVDGFPIRVPDATDLLVQVCYHSRKLDSHARCRWVIDALTLINGTDSPVDWNALANRSEEADIVLPVRDALSYLHNEFGPIETGNALERFHNIATTKEDRDSYFEQMSASTANRGIAELVLSQWRLYKGVRRSRNESATWPGFVRYYAQFLKWRWRVPSLARLPGTAVWRRLERLRPGPERRVHGD